MSEREEPGDGRFKKGISGNPSGRPKKPLDFDSTLMRAINTRVRITQSGKAKVITKRELAAIQVANQAASGKRSAIRQVSDSERRVQERLQNSNRILRTSRTTKTGKKRI
jgi:hypothetical protein